MLRIAVALWICLAALPAAARPGPAAQFSTYHVKPGASAAFLRGYREHLEWHLKARDRWPWYVWEVVSGERQGLYVGGSFDHDWAEMERRPKPAEDGAHHEKTIDPHLDRAVSRYLERRADLGGRLESFESPYLAVIEVRVRPGERAAFERAVKSEGSGEGGTGPAHAWFEVVSGDQHPTYLAFVSLERRADLVAAAPHRVAPRTGVAAIRSELLALLRDTSTCKRPQTRCLGVVPR